MRLGLRVRVKGRFRVGLIGLGYDGYVGLDW